MANDKTIRSSLNKILNRREDDKKTFKETIDRIYKIRQFVEDFQTLSGNQDWKLLLRNNQELNTEWQSLVKEVKDCDFIGRVSRLIDLQKDENGNPVVHDSLEKIWKRLSRKFVSVAVMGTISSGKSTLLRTLTGLEDNVIPTGNDKCTATRTRFQYCETTEAIVHLQKIEKIKEIILAHVNLLNLYWEKNKENKSMVLQINSQDSLDQIISSIKAKDDFLTPEKYDNASIIKEKGNPTSGFAKDYCITLKDYVNNYETYKYILIGSNSTNSNNKELNNVLALIKDGRIVFSEAQIDNGLLKPFVSYDDNKPWCYATEKVEVKCPFPSGDLKGIELVDTMGIGEAKVGVEEELTETLKNGVDIAIALHRVKPSDTYDKDQTSKAFHLRIKESTKEDGDREPEKWVYYLLNIEKGGVNSDEIEKMKGKIVGDLSPISLPDASWGELEVTDKLQANNYFINTVLGNLEKSISEIDKTFTKKAYEDIAEIENIYDSILDSFRRLKMPNLDFDQYVEKQIDSIFGKASQIVENLRTKETEKKKAYNEQIKEDIKTELETCYPVKEYIQKSNGLTSPDEVSDSTISAYLNSKIDGDEKGGRELKVFSDIREHIIERMYLVLTSFKYGWFEKEAAARKDNVAAALYKDDPELRKYVSAHLFGLNWLKKLSDEIKDKNFTSFVDEYETMQLEVVKRIKRLFEPIRDQVIYNIDLTYTNKAEAADKIGTQLGIIEDGFKTLIKEKFDEIFNQEYDIFNPIMSYFLNNLIFNESTSAPKARRALSIYIRKNFKSIYQSNDYERMNGAIVEYKNILANY